LFRLQQRPIKIMSASHKTPSTGLRSWVPFMSPPCRSLIGSRPIIQSRLIYLAGGFPRHLEQSLSGSKGWQAMRKAHQLGAVLAGSSAGAMILCSHYYDPYEKQIYKGLGLIPNACILPHHNTFGRNWSRELPQRLGDAILIGIDEKTGMINDGPAGRWQVYGAGGVTRYRKDRIAHFHAGESFGF
jgi:cyanophycinase